MTRIEATQADVGSAWSSLRDGDTLALKGKIGPMRFPGRKFATPVTIDLSAAELSDFYMGGLDGVRFVGGLVRPGQTHRVGFRIGNSSRLSFEGIKIAGTGTDWGTWDTGLWLENCRDVTIGDLLVDDMVTGIKLFEVDGAQVRRCDIGRMKADAIDLFGVRDFVVEDNFLHDFAPAPGSHPDGIQGLTNLGKPKTARGVIRRNRIVGTAQPIFLGAPNAEQGFEDIAIEENQVASTYSNGIYVGWGKRIKVTGNAVATLAGALNRSDIKLLNCTEATRSANLVEAYAIPGGRTWTELADADYVPPVPPKPAEPKPIEITLKPGETLIVRGAA